MFKYGKKKPQGATRNIAKSVTPSTPSTQGLLPSWLLVGFGVAVGLFGAFVLYLWQPWKPVQKPAPVAMPETTTSAANATPTGEPRFDFYTLLPSQKVSTPESALPKESDTPTAKTSTNQPSKPVMETQKTPIENAKSAEKPTSLDADNKKSVTANTERSHKTEKTEKTKAEDKQKEKAKAEKLAQDKTNKDKEAKATAQKTQENQAKEAENKDKTRYNLQAGSFKNSAEADRRRAEIMMSGLPVKVQKVTVKPGEDWYRVVVGPFNGKEKAVAASGTLRGEGIDNLMVKAK
ncbi:SPOR domain-containing protein [Agitococcus lubricus]|uniref:Cell division protein FtsN n=1 Tax=Agitococcus lubricus TaxID=1077255 RepID=A0A2T5IWE2_9GAMM|nr:SPOR domain-containing protein [Agitococcus lubricus]PTQ88203.1 cell division protein FtsN [Agitococcus lubricus]